MSGEVISFAIAPNGTLFYIDSATSSLFWTTDWKTVKPFFCCVALQRPTAVAASSKYVYVADQVAHSIYVFDRGGELKQRYTVEPDTVPDKLVLFGPYLYGMNYHSKTISRFLLTVSIEYAAQLTKVAGSMSVLPPHHLELVSSQITLESVNSPTDFAVSSAGVFVLDAQAARVTTVSFQGGGAAVVSVAGLVSSPTSLAADEERLVLADKAIGNFDLFQDVVPVTFYFEGQSAPADMNLLFSLLSERRLLPTRPYQVEQGLTWGTLAKESQFSAEVGEYEAAGLLCSVNTANCEKAQVWDAPVNLQTIRVPDVSITKYTGEEDVWLGKAARNHPGSGVETRGLTLKAVATTRSGYSNQLEMKTALLKSNPRYKGRDILGETEGHYIVPVVGFETTALVSARMLKDGSVPDELARNYKPTVPPPVKPKSFFQLQEQPSKEAIVAPQTTVAPQTSVVAEAPSPDPLCPKQANTLDAWLQDIDYCFPQDVGTELVAVVDFAFNPTHPLFPPNSFELFSAPNTSRNTKLNEDGVQVPEVGDHSITPRDHGTYVAGLIAGRVVNDEQRGVDPYAHIFGVQVADFDRAVRDGRFSIFNLSLGPSEYNQGSSVFSNYSQPSLTDWEKIISRRQRVLFVIAAGNENKQLSGGDFAADVASNTNVLVVMASTTRPAALAPWGELDGGTNFGYPFVAVAAPGQNIESGTFSGQFGIGSGSSQATALVSGAAAILRSRYNWAPWQIRQRIISTSNLDPWLAAYHDRSIGGILDVKRAVLFGNRAYVKLVSGEECLGRITTAEARTLTVTKEDGGGPVTIPYSMIRRIHKPAKDKNWIVYYSEVERDLLESKNPEQPTVLVRLSFSMAEVRDNSDSPEDPTFEFDEDPTSQCKYAKIRVSEINDLYNGFY
jgi:hypothetical protein